MKLYRKFSSRCQRHTRLQVFSHKPENKANATHERMKKVDERHRYPQGFLMLEDIFFLGNSR
jgi:hypothetical protein